MAGITVTTLQLPGLDNTSAVARGCLIIALVMAVQATFFTCLQQQTYGFIEHPAAVRAWLSNGKRYFNSEGREVLQSSTISHQLLYIPFELLCISITTFHVGIGIYLGSAYVQSVELSSDPTRWADRSVMIAYIVSSGFALSLLGQLLGGKDFENRKLHLRPVDAVPDGDKVPTLYEKRSNTWPIHLRSGGASLV